MTAPFRRKAPSIGAGCSLAAATFLVLLPLSAVVRGALLAKLWEWFVADPFATPYLSTLQAIGISTIAAFLLYSGPANKHADDISLGQAFGTLLVSLFGTYAVTFLSALVVVQFR